MPPKLKWALNKTPLWQQGLPQQELKTTDFHYLRRCFKYKKNAGHGPKAMARSGRIPIFQFPSYNPLISLSQYTIDAK